MAAIAVAAGVFWLWLRSDLGDPQLRTIISDGVFFIVPVIAAIACWSAHRARKGRHTAWAWLSLGCLVWASGAVVWAVYTVGYGRTAPFPSWADLGFIGYSLPVAFGLTRFPRSSVSVWSRWRLLLDGAVIALSLLLASTIWVLGPVINATTDSLTRLDGLAYPLADVVVAAIVMSRCMVLPQARRRVLVPLFVGLLTLTATDSIYIAQTLSGRFHTGHSLDVGWLVSFALVALAAWAPGFDATSPTPGTDSDPPTLAQEVVPYLALALGATALVTSSTVAQHLSSYLWLVVPLIVLAGARQLVVVADHLRLTGDLGDAVRRRTNQLAVREEWWRVLVQNLSDVVIVLSTEGVVRYCSPSAHTALGDWSNLHTADDLHDRVHPDDQMLVRAAVRPVLVGSRRRAFLECRLQRAPHEWGWFEVDAVGQLMSGSLEGVVITLHDVTARRQLTDRLREQAFHDALTSLPNRSLLLERVEQVLLERPTTGFALLLMDLDDFKVINDRHGHLAGDAVLQVVAERLRSSVKTGDVVARLGGDEFALLVFGRTETVRTTAERLIARVAEPIAVGERRFLVRASAGVVFPDAGQHETSYSLLSHADIALYEAKAHGKGRVVFVAGEARADAAKQVQLREQMAHPRLAEFYLLYQPIVELATGRLRGVECLLRWDHPQLGPIAPDVFIPMSEHGGSIQVLGWHVLTLACRQLARWRTEHPRHHLSMGINVSTLQLEQPGFARRVLALVDDHHIEPDQIVLELTEQSLVVDLETAAAVVAELRAGGISVAIDDYGTGHSSLSYLHRLPADVLKVDRSFVATIDQSEHTRKIVGSVIHMAKSLDLQSIAEGIETATQLALVRDLGCELGQGFLFSRPVHASEIRTILDGGETSGRAAYAELIGTACPDVDIVVPLPSGQSFRELYPRV